MTKKQMTAVGLILLTGAVLSTVFLVRGSQSQREGDHGPESENADERGPHGGRMLRDPDGFAVEVTIYEPDIPPQSRVYAFRKDTPIDPSTVNLKVELHRFDRVDAISYKPQDGYLQGDKIVEEPHSFDVQVNASSGGKHYSWKYASYEGRVEIKPDSAASGGIVLELAEPRKLAVRVPALGHVRLNEDTSRHLSPRYSGVVRELRKQVGDLVRAGETVAIVEGNESLQAFEIRSAGTGRVVEKRVTTGETVASGGAIYVVADLKTVWVDFTIYRADAERVLAGQRVQLRSGEKDILTGKLSYVAPISDSASQSFTARAVVENGNSALRPGLFVQGDIFVEEVEVPVAVKEGALQTFRDWDVVFRNKGSLYEIAIVELGIRDDGWVEVRSGLSVGQAYVARNSFVVKAEIGKSGATHDH